MGGASRSGLIRPDQSFLVVFWDFPHKNKQGNLRKEKNKEIPNCDCDFLTQVKKSQRFLGPKVFSPQGPLNGGLSNGGFSQSGLVLPNKSFFVVFGGLSRFFFWNFSPICSGIVRGFSRLVLFLFRAPTRNSPERVRDTIRTFPEKSGKPPGLETPPLPSRSTFPQSFPCIWIGTGSRMPNID